MERGGVGRAWIAPHDLRFTFARSGGPGGQAVNKISTKANLRVRVGDIHGLDGAAAARLRKAAGRRLTQNDELLISAESHRSQLSNKLECLDRLQQLIAAALIVPKQRRKKKPTRAMIEKRLAGKRQRSEKKKLRQSRRRFDAE